MPVLNFLLTNLRQKFSFSIVAVSMLLFTPCSIFKKDVFGLNDGHSFLWFVALYFIGGYIKEYWKLSRRIRRYAFAYCLSGLFLWGFQFLTDFTTNKIIVYVKGIGYFVSYLSPFIILMIISLLMFFSCVKVLQKVNSIIKFLSPCVFGIYLAHVHPLVKEVILKNAFERYCEKNLVMFTFAVTITSISIYIIGTVVDLMRI